MFRFEVLGALGLTGPEGSDPRAVLSQPKRVALLAYLALSEPAGFLRRDAILPLLWPELGQEEARRALRQSLHFLRQNLSPELIENRGAEEIGLSRSATSCDVWDFRAAVDSGRYEDALSAYRGDLLPGFYVSGAAPEFEQWLASRRESIARTAREVARKLAESAESDGRSETAVRAARIAAAMPGGEERDVLRLMRLLRAAGEATAALDVYESFARWTVETHGARPGRALIDLAADMRREMRQGATQPSAPVGQAVVASSPAPQRDEARAEAPTAAARTAVAPPVAPVTSAPPTASAGKRGRWALWLGGAATAIVFAALAVAPFRSRPTATSFARSASEAAPRVAVAPFENGTGDTALDPIGTMASDWITRELARLPRVEIVDVGAMYASAAAGRGRPMDARRMADDNGATLAVTGTYYARGGDALQFSARILDVASGRVLRVVDSVGASRRNPMEGIEELRQRVATALGTVVDPQSAIIASPALAPPRFDAYEEYVRGQETYWRGDFRGALPHFLRSAALDSSFTGALTFASVAATGVGECALSDSLVRVLDARAERVPEMERLTGHISRARCANDWGEALRLQRRRAELNPGSKYIRWTASAAARQVNRPGEALALLESIDPEHDLGWLPENGRTFYWREVAGALHAIGRFTDERDVGERLIAAGGHPLFGRYLAARARAGAGDAAGAIAALAEVGTLPADPTITAAQMSGALRAPQFATAGWVMFDVASELGAHGHPDDARRLARQAAEWFRRRATTDSLSPEERFVLARSLDLAGMASEARRVLDALVADRPDVAEFHGALGIVAAHQGDRPLAREADAWLTARGDGFAAPVALLQRAGIAAALGDTDNALDLLDRLPFGNHPYHYLEFHSDPALWPLHGTPRFQRRIRPQG